jgi:hypothetical protein
VLALVLRAPDEEWGPAVPAKQPSAAGAEPLSPEERAGAQQDQLQALVVDTPLLNPSYRAHGGDVQDDQPATGQSRWTGHRR